MNDLLDADVDHKGDSLRALGSRTAERTILLVCPTMWDEGELPHIVDAGRYRVLIYGSDVSEHPEDFDAIDFIDRAAVVGADQDVDGVMASDDYPGSIVAAAIAQQLNLPGPHPEAVLLCHHKYYSRVAQQRAVPEAVPTFDLVDPTRVPIAPNGLSFPMFVKPVKSFFSLFAQEVADGDELRALAQRAHYHLREFVKPFNQLLARYTAFPLNGSYILAETPLHGQQVTVEGCVFHGEGRIIGITDSIMYPGTISFQRFEYPSVLSSAIQDLMSELALRFMHSIGFDDGLFNIEMFYDSDSEAISIIEVNPRMCPQFADLMEKVNGVNTYEIALSIAAGIRPHLNSEARTHRVAMSFALRLFEDSLVTRVPNAVEIAVMASLFPDARLKVLCREGHRLSEELQDGKSYRYAVLNLGAESRADALVRCERALRILPFSFEVIAPATPRNQEDNRSVSGKVLPCLKDPAH
ncbi:MAG: ATP-grasp domain-containing protein [Steroidobacteraceae bacterium]